MKPTRLSLSITNIGLLTILIACSLVWCKSGCPPSDDIAPCVCTNNPYTVLDCKGIVQDEILKGVFEHSEGYTFKEVHVAYSTLKYFPIEMVDKSGVQEIYLTNSTLNALFDSSPNNVHTLRKIHLENTKIIEITHWELLQSLTHLEILTIYFNNVGNLDSTFGEYVNNDLAQLSFYSTGTKHIAPGALVKFTGLDRLSVDACQLTKLTRDIFPTPFKIRVIYFNDNEISVIPDDLFTDMPKLETVGLRNNLIKTLPESAFRGRNTHKLIYLVINDNPINCDCSLLWLVKDKPQALRGNCATPLRLHGKEIKDLTPKDLKCKGHL